MAANHHPSPTMAMQAQHSGPPGPPSQQPPAHPQQGQRFTPSQQVPFVTEALWMQVGSCAEALGDLDDAYASYEAALRANPNSIPAMNALSLILRTREQFSKAVEYLQSIIKIDNHNGEAWGSLGHCYLMMDDLQQAYTAYQNALVNLRNPKEPKLWYGIGILYDRYGSLEHAEEAFSQVMQMEPNFEKANEIYFRLGIIYKQQQKYGPSLECFKYIVSSPPPPLSEEDILFQIGHVHEQQKDYDNAKAAYQRVLERDPAHAKVLQQLGWLHHQQSSTFASQERAIEFLEKSVAADQNDAQSWYLLGRCYMSQQKYPKAYEAYQQAVYRDGRNPTFWCSIGVLYYQINQYRDALDAYSRAIRLNPFISEVWYDLGTLYESCNNQISDAMDAYQRAAELDPNNPHIKARLSLLRNGPTNGQQPPAAPQPADVHPASYQVGPAPPQWGSSAPQQSSAPQPPPPQGGPGAHAWGRLADINPPPQPNNPFDQGREGFRGGQAPPLHRQPSPRQEQQHRSQYSESSRPGSVRRGATPPPSHYNSGGPSSSGPAPPPQGGPQSHQAPTSQPRVPNPNYVPTPSSAQMPSMNPGPSGGPPPGQQPPFRGTNSPRPGERPPHENRMPSPKSAYPQHPPPGPYNHQHEGPSGPHEGPPPASQAAGEARGEERPPSIGPKRMREWEEDSAHKRPANDENKARLDDVRGRRPSTPAGGHESYRRNSGEGRRFEEQRREEEPRRPEEMRRGEEPQQSQQQQPPQPGDAYYPSEAAHHPPGQPGSAGAQLPPMQTAGAPMQGVVHDGPQSAPPSASKEFHAEERAPLDQTPTAARAAPTSEPERAARKMDVDEDYDDSGEDEKKPAAMTSNGAGPTNGSGPTSASGDSKTPSSSVNGMMGSVTTKTESTT